MSYRDCHLLGMRNCSSDFTVICWATSEVVHRFVDNNGFRSGETLNYIISSEIWGPTRHLSLKITNSLGILRLRKPLKPQPGWPITGFEPGTSRMRVSCVTTKNQDRYNYKEKYKESMRCYNYIIN